MYGADGTSLEPAGVDPAAYHAAGLGQIGENMEMSQLQWGPYGCMPLDDAQWAAWTYAMLCAQQLSGSPWQGGETICQKQEPKKQRKRANKKGCPIPRASSVSSSNLVGETQEDAVLDIEASDIAEILVQLGKPTEMGLDAEKCRRVNKCLEVGSADVVPWLMDSLVSLAFSKHGCRVVQKALDQAGKSDRELLAAQLQGSVTQMYLDENGNHVLQKLIEVMPPAHLGFLFEELAGRWAVVARHRFGCRVIERLIEHSSETDTQIAHFFSPMLDELEKETEQLARHPYGNFVVQHLLEHLPSIERRARLVERMKDTMGVLAKHKTASHVVQQALTLGGDAAQRTIVDALLCAEGELALPELACSRYGCFVVQQLVHIPYRQFELRECFVGKFVQLEASQYGKRVLETFEIVAPSSAAP